MNENRAKELVKLASAKDKGILALEYLGTKLVPYLHIKNSYKLFPDELRDKNVYVFEGLSSEDEKVSVALCQYYVAENGDLYKDTYPSNAQCIKIGTKFDILLSDETTDILKYTENFKNIIKTYDFIDGIYRDSLKEEWPGLELKLTAQQMERLKNVQLNKIIIEAEHVANQIHYINGGILNSTKTNIDEENNIFSIRGSLTVIKILIENIFGD